MHHHLAERVHGYDRGGEPLEPEARVPLPDQTAGVPIHPVRDVLGPVRVDPRLVRRVFQPQHRDAPLQLGHVAPVSLRREEEHRRVRVPRHDVPLPAVPLHALHLRRVAVVLVHHHPAILPAFVHQVLVTNQHRVQVVATRRVQVPVLAAQRLHVARGDVDVVLADQVVGVLVALEVRPDRLAAQAGEVVSERAVAHAHVDADARPIGAKGGVLRVRHPHHDVDVHPEPIVRVRVVGDQGVDRPRVLVPVGRDAREHLVPRPEARASVASEAERRDLLAPLRLLRLAMRRESVRKRRVAVFPRAGPPVRSIPFALFARDAVLPSPLALRALLQLRQPLPAAVHHPRVPLPERVNLRQLARRVTVTTAVMPRPRRAERRERRALRGGRVAQPDARAVLERARRRRRRRRPADDAPDRIRPLRRRRRHERDEHQHEREAARGGRQEVPDSTRASRARGRRLPQQRRRLGLVGTGGGCGVPASRSRAPAASRRGRDAERAPRGRRDARRRHRPVRSVR